MAPPTHGAKALAARMRDNRIEPRTRRALSRLQRELAASPWETLAALVQGRLARRELLCQRVEAYLLATPESEGGKWLLGLWAAQRRDVELLALLVQRDEGRQAGTPCQSCGMRFADLQGYVDHRQTCSTITTTTEPPPDAPTAPTLPGAHPAAKNAAQPAAARDSGCLAEEPTR